MHGSLCLVYEAGLPQGGVVSDGRAGGGEKAGQRVPRLQPARPVQRHQGVQRTSGEHILEFHMDQCNPQLLYKGKTARVRTVCF